MTKIRGIVFDKDGTLFDFNATWGAWTREMIAAESAGDPAVTARMAEVMGYDLDNQQFRQGSIVIAETVETVASHVLPLLPAGTGLRDLIARMNAKSAEVPQIEAAPLAPLMAAFRAGGLRLGVATNDAEAPARAHLTRAGVLGQMDFVAGFDSGHGAKPGPGPLLAFCAATGLAPENCLMVGDSRHDLTAGRAAGMQTAGVLTGPARADELADLADVVLPSIADLPRWLGI